MLSALFYLTGSRVLCASATILGTKETWETSRRLKLCRTPFVLPLRVNVLVKEWRQTFVVIKPREKNMTYQTKATNWNGCRRRLTLVSHCGKRDTDVVSVRAYTPATRNKVINRIIYFTSYCISRFGRVDGSITLGLTQKKNAYSITWSDLPI